MSTTHEESLACILLFYMQSLFPTAYINFAIDQRETKMHAAIINQFPSAIINATRY